jgi:hypothetical protein
MYTLIVIALVVGLLLYYVLSLDFEIGTGFTEMRKKIREGKYRIISTKDKNTNQETKLLN